MLKLHTFSCLVAIYDLVCLFGVKIIGLSSLEVSFSSFLNSLSLHSLPQLVVTTPPSPSPLLCVVYYLCRLRERL
jgi:hypothetical protein